MRRRFPWVPAVLLALLLPAGAAASRERGAAGLDQALRDLATDVRAVCFAAHPDDEDAETLSLLRRKHGVETTVVCYTRGEGGQNEIGPSLYAALGALRTRETRAAAREVGAKLRFLDFPDFGYSRTAAETFEKWGREEVLRRTVRALREIRPHLVITNHDVEGGHGHHQAVGITALDAFEAAADPKRFPEEGKPWAVKKLFVACAPERATARPDTGAVDLVRGLSFAEMGLRSLRHHRSQGTWDLVVVEPGPRVKPYRLVKSRVEDGAGALLAGLPPARPECLTEEWRTGTRAEILERVLALRERPEEERPASEKLDRAVAAATGVTLDLELEDRELVPGESATVRATLRNGGPRALDCLASSFRWSHGGGGGQRPSPETVAPGRAGTFEIPLTLPEVVLPNAPFEDHLYDRTGVSSAFEVVLPLLLRGPERVPFSVRAAVDLPIFPAVRVEIGTWGRLLRPTDLERRLKVTITNHSPEPVEEEVRVSFTGTDRIEATTPEPVTVPAGTAVVVPVALSPKEGVEEGLYGIRVEFGAAVAEDRVRVLRVGIPGELRVGVVTTYGEEEYRALEALGLEPRALTDEDLEIGDLSDFDAIVLGIRAYLARPVLRRVNGRLLDFVAAGGTLLVNYNKEREWSPAYAPFRLEIGRDRVTREDAPIDFTDPENPVLDYPNEVTPEDFDGWVQERGLYFPSDWDRGSFRTVLRTADPGRPLIPALLVAKHGEGTWIYTSLVWYRQLRVLNPAALKMLANLVTAGWPH